MTNLILSYCHLNNFDLKLSGGPVENTFTWVSLWILLCHSCILGLINFKVWFQTMADYLSNLVPFSASLPNMLWGKKKIGPTCWLFLIRRKGWVADKLAFQKSVCDLNSGLNLYSFIFFLLQVLSNFICKTLCTCM